MERYINFGGDAHIVAFDVASDAIRIECSCGSIRLYTEQTLGHMKFHNMKNIAMQGGQLGRYISRNAKSGYDLRVKEYRKVCGGLIKRNAFRETDRPLKECC